MRYLGIDMGTKKVGLALSDEAGSMGFPHSVVPNDAKLAERIRSLIASESVGAVVIGDSRDFSGAENRVAKAARAFGDLLGKEAGVPTFFEPEALTTQEARRGFDGTRGHPEKLDASAAALILTSYLGRPRGHEA